MKYGKRLLARREQRGSALIAVAISMVGIAMLSLALISVTSSAANTQRQSKDETASLYVAEAGVADALFALEQGAGGDIGSAGQPATFGGTSYWVDTSPNGDGTFSIISTGLGGTGGARIEVVVEPTGSPFFRWGAFGDEWLSLDSQAMVDSYDSTAGSYLDQATNGSGSELHADEEGSTGSNGDVTLDQNSLIWGDSSPGVDGTITILSNAEVSGSTMPLEAPMEMPEIELPVIATTGPLDIAKDTSQTLAAGEYHFSRLRAMTGSTLEIYGPATIIFDSFVMYSNADIIVHPEAGPVEFYVQKDFIINSNSTIGSTTQRPKDVIFNLLSDNIIDVETDVDLDELDFDSNAKLFGTIYAPSAAITIDSNFELFGSIVARQLDLDSNCRIHYDVNLLEEADEDAGFAILCWRELPYHPGKYGE